ncbi:YbhB/YbcL family Raf kinase inhibitor-like protein [Azonexus sp.]|jgi:Raf kinase inhibitor-like YbhB/YbcL family protein|uniref:YbhB/YbcL family Raf kinase inhibitor-like protein n=1 Tax=Azonexus sp. TaxID=1872668 RepID=UPI002821F3C0|nr:YbhB/YbcL family Raf kinase inhibitor-like protein [Azonexus sp.]MDR1994259.1 YbhB/YbcL family Raf kinase inhibitor-like protein [Azonexus sp.]
MKRTMCVCFLALGVGIANAGDFKLASEAFASGKLASAQYANSFGCSGGNISPDLSWSNPPAGTKSYVVTLYDPDAPTGSGWWHWVVANLPATTAGLPAGVSAAQLPAGAREINTDTGTPGFIGACPPAGEEHRYILTVYALNVERLDLPPNATPAMLGFTIRNAILDRASLTARGSR